MRASTTLNMAMISSAEEVVSTKIMPSGCDQARIDTLNRADERVETELIPDNFHASSLFD